MLNYDSSFRIDKQHIINIKRLAGMTGIEPVAHCLEGSCSIL